MNITKWKYEITKNRNGFGGDGSIVESGIIETNENKLSKIFKIIKEKHPQYAYLKIYGEKKKTQHYQITIYEK